MAKTVYITEEQFKNLKESIIKEDDNKLEIPIVNTTNTSATPNAKMTTAQIGQEIRAQKKDAMKNGIPLNKVEYVVDPNKIAEGYAKTYTKKQIEEAKIKKIIGNSPKYSKTDFQNRFF